MSPEAKNVVSDHLSKLGHHLTEELSAEKLGKLAIDRINAGDYPHASVLLRAIEMLRDIDFEKYVQGISASINDRLATLGIDKLDIPSVVPTKTSLETTPAQVVSETPATKTPDLISQVQPIAEINPGLTTLPKKTPETPKEQKTRPALTLPGTGPHAVRGRRKPDKYISNASAVAATLKLQSTEGETHLTRKIGEAILEPAQRNMRNFTDSTKYAWYCINRAGDLFTLYATNNPGISVETAFKEAHSLAVANDQKEWADFYLNALTDPRYSGMLLIDFAQEFTKQESQKAEQKNPKIEKTKKRNSSEIKPTDINDTDEYFIAGLLLLSDRDKFLMETTPDFPGIKTLADKIGICTNGDCIAETVGVNRQRIKLEKITSKGLKGNPDKLKPFSLEERTQALATLRRIIAKIYQSGSRGWHNLDKKTQPGCSVVVEVIKAAKRLNVSDIQLYEALTKEKQLTLKVDKNGLVETVSTQ